MNHLIFKIIIGAVLALFSDYAIANVFYPHFLQPMLLGIVLGIVGYYMERGMLRPGTVWLATVMDIVIVAVVVYFSPFIFPGARVTLDGALLTALIFGIEEYVYHAWLVRREGTARG